MDEEKLNEPLLDVGPRLMQEYRYLRRERCLVPPNRSPQTVEKLISAMFIDSRINRQFLNEVKVVRIQRARFALIAITGTTGYATPIVPAAAGRDPDIASVSQPSASGQTGKRVCR